MCYELNNKMLSLTIHACYESLQKKKFCNFATFISRINQQREHFIV